MSASTSNNRTSVAVFMVQRIGPYHHARLSAWAAARGRTIAVIEFRADDPTYRWSPVSEPGAYERYQTRSRDELCCTLDRLKPGVVVCVGYADPEISQAMVWAHRHHVPLVTCSDSTYTDEKRSWLTESFKQRVVRGFDAALVAGARAHQYLGRLGVPRERRFQPWDVVDNRHFERGADASRKNAEALRQKLNLPAHYFFCVARFVTKKNLGRLIDAYALYRRSAGAEAWSLVLSGSGPLEALLRACAADAGVKDSVHFPGFLQYPILPVYYGLAGALVLPSLSDQWGLVVNEAMAAGLPVLVSSNCGCAPDLVRAGENGFIFESRDTKELAEHFVRMAALDGSQRAEMGRRSREIIAGFSPEAFAEGLEQAIACAIGPRPKYRSRLSRLLVGFLAMRGVRTL